MTTVVTTGTNSPITVLGLAAGSWKFTVSANNGIGSSSSSPYSAAVTITAAPVATVILVNRGTWSSTVPYAYDDYVTYNGATWYCVNQTGVLGVVPGTDSTRWGTTQA